VKLHVIIDPNAVKIRIIASTLTASASELGHPGLKAALDRPYQCNDEDRER